MATFLSLPLEVRQCILLESSAIHEPSPRTPNDIKTSNRILIPNEYSNSWIGEERVHFQKRPLSSLPSLRLVNQQLNNEIIALYSLNNKKRPNYSLDVIFIRYRSLWPTWTSIPRLTKHVGTIHACLRLSSRSER